MNTLSIILSLLFITIGVVATLYFGYQNKSQSEPVNDPKDAKPEPPPVVETPTEVVVPTPVVNTPPPVAETPTEAKPAEEVKVEVKKSKRRYYGKRNRNFRKPNNSKTSTQKKSGDNKPTKVGKPPVRRKKK